SPVVTGSEGHFRVSLRFTTNKSGTAELRSSRAGRVFKRLSAKVAAGRVKIGPFPVALSGFYTFQVKLAGKTIHWTACLGGCGLEAPGRFILKREPPSSTRNGDVWAVTLHLRANRISQARLRGTRDSKVLFSKRFLGNVGQIAIGPFLLKPGSYTL